MNAFADSAFMSGAFPSDGGVDSSPPVNLVPPSLSDTNLPLTSSVICDTGTWDLSVLPEITHFTYEWRTPDGSLGNGTSDGNTYYNTGFGEEIKCAVTAYSAAGITQVESSNTCLFFS